MVMAGDRPEEAVPGRYTRRVMARLCRRLLGIACLVGVAVAVARVRSRLATPTPLGIPAGTPVAAAPGGETAPAPGDDLSQIRGVGPVYGARLGDVGITGFAALAAADPALVAAAVGVTPGRAADWISQAAALAAR
jgi:predicted flap endonuclease-1-like 5' DNA nuclease